MSTSEIILAQTGLTRILSTIHGAFVSPPSISLASPILAPPAGFNNVSTQTIVSGGLNRSYAVNIPKDYNSRVQDKWPLIIDYHGHTHTPHNQWDNSQYWDFSDGQDYLVAYPLGIQLSWQGASYAEDGVDDLLFTSDLLAHLKATYNIDPDRVYASGKSNGGGLVDLLACSDNGDEFAAFAMASAALYQDNSLRDCSRKRAIIESHGLLDDVIPYEGGESAGGRVPDISSWVRWWGQRSCGDAARANTTSSDSYDLITYSCGGLTDVVQHYKIFDLGHCWPSSSGDNFDSDFKPCKDKSVNFTQNVLDFFSRWNLTNAPKN